MARSLVLLSFIFIVIVAPIHARSIEHHIRTRAVCPAGMCLSKFGYCGDTIDYCGEGCQAGACYGGPCPLGMCLSQHGFCGTTDAYCGVGCRAGPCYGGAITLPPVVTVTVPSVANTTLPPVVTVTLPSISTSTLPSGVDDHSGDGTFYDRK